MATRWHWGFRFFCTYVALLDTFDFGNQWCVYLSCVLAMTSAMSDKPITGIVQSTRFQRYFMRYIPILSGHNLHAAQVANAKVPRKNLDPHFSCYTFALH
jgi:hypothetical protein